MYKPQYLNVERKTKNVMAGNMVYFTKVTLTPLGYKKKPHLNRSKINQAGDLPESEGDPYI